MSLKNQKGFTLVELAIVLVIIGLIVGGVLVGQDLIKAASIRAVTSDLEKYNAAANTFRTKYAGLPGDLISSSAAQFGLQARTGATGRGDGNGLIEGGAAAAVIMGYETTLFWRDLSEATLIPISFTAATDAVVANTASAATISTFIPGTRLRPASHLQILSRSGRNFWMLANVTAIAGGTGTQTVGVALTGGEARAIDEKTDDSLPLTGITTAVTDMAGTLETAAVAAAAVCVQSGTTPASYNVQDAFVNNINCRIQSRTSF